jgi:hypothetical protein
MDQSMFLLFKGGISFLLLQEDPLQEDKLRHLTEEAQIVLCDNR